MLWKAEQLEFYYSAIGNANGTATVEDSLAVSWKSKILLPYNPAIALPGIWPKELKTYVHTKTCTRIFLAALFIIAITWKQPRCVAHIKIAVTHVCIHREMHVWKCMNKKMNLFLFIYACVTLSCVQLFATPWTVAHQAPLLMEFPRQEHWSG